MIASDPRKAAQDLEKWAGELEKRSARYTQLHQRMTALAVTETSTDGAVRVTVDGNGLPTELTVTERGRSVDPARLSAELMACLRRAQATLRAQVEEVTRETVGDDGAGANIVAQYAQRFPDPEAEPSGPPRRPSREHQMTDVREEWDER